MYEKRRRVKRREYKVAKLPKLRAFLVPPFSDAGVISKNIRSWVRLGGVYSIYLFLFLSPSFGLHSNILSVLPIRTFVSRTRSSLEKRSWRKRQNKLASSGDGASVDLISILEWVEYSSLALITGSFGISPLFKYYLEIKVARLYTPQCRERKREREEDARTFQLFTIYNPIADTWDYLQVRALLAARTTVGEFESVSREKKKI